MADWSALPQELLYMISLLLTSYDIIRFRSVCTAWRAAAVQPRPDPTSSNPIITDLLGCFIYDTVYLAKRTFYALQSPNNNPLWIICLGQDINSNHMNSLYNPFISLGRIKKFPPTFSKSFSFLNFSVLELGETYTVCSDCSPRTFSPPRNNKAAVLKRLDDTFVILSFRDSSSGELNVYESGVKEWKAIKVPVTFETLADVITVGGKFYAIDYEGRLLDVNHIDLSVRIVVDNPAMCSIPGVGRTKKFLVECEGNLVLVNMYYGDFEDYPYLYNMVHDFDVFRLDANAGEWVEVHDLGGMILFVGATFAFSASAKDIFAETGTPTYGKGNCIFFYDHDMEKLGVRVFDMETGTIKKFDIRTDNSLIFWPPPAWAFIN